MTHTTPPVPQPADGEPEHCDVCTWSCQWDPDGICVRDMPSEEPETAAEDREHLVYADADGNLAEPAECIDDCPGCHFEGNTDCDAGPGNCDICTGQCEPTLDVVIV